MNIRRLRARLERIEAQANSLSGGNPYEGCQDWAGDLENHPLKEFIEACGGVVDEAQRKLDRERRK
jgi:hypothetical protein